MAEGIVLATKYRVLLVDDDEDYLEAYRDELEGRDIKKEDIKCAEDSQSAVEILERQLIHVVVLDNYMKDLTGKPSPRAGLDLDDYIKEHYPCVSRLMVTEGEEIPHYVEAREKGMYDYLLKSKSSNIVKEMADTVFEMFERRRVPIVGEGIKAFKADPLHFYGKRGKVVKEVSMEIGEMAGLVAIDGQIWRATTKGTPQPFPLKKGDEVRAEDIEFSSVRVVALDMYY
jgi:DNA-binding NtrC family response regulator